MGENLPSLGRGRVTRSMDAGVARPRAVRTGRSNSYEVFVVPV